jgi:hypothetical protein
MDQIRLDRGADDSPKAGSLPFVHGQPAAVRGDDFEAYAL